MRTAVLCTLAAARASTASLVAGCVLLAASWASAGAAGDLADGAHAALAGDGAPPGVVELFTSQGCPKCPPADRLIAELARQPKTIAVTYPVSLWDFEGWKDTLASAAFTQRQRDYAAARGDRRIFTPQAIVDGVGVEAGADRAAIARDATLIAGRGGAMSVPMRLSEPDGRLHVAVGERPGREAAGVYVLRVVRAEAVEIGRGQNSGRKVTYTNVVRAISKLGDYTGQAVDFDMPELKGDGEGYVVLLQAGRPDKPGPILAAAKTPDL